MRAATTPRRLHRRRQHARGLTARPSSAGSDSSSDGSSDADTDASTTSGPDSGDSTVTALTARFNSVLGLAGSAAGTSRDWCAFTSPATSRPSSSGAVSELVALMDTHAGGQQWWGQRHTSQSMPCHARSCSSSEGDSGRWCRSGCGDTLQDLQQPAVHASPVLGKRKEPPSHTSQPEAAAEAANDDRQHQQQAEAELLRKRLQADLQRFRNFASVRDELVGDEAEAAREVESRRPLNSGVQRQLSFDKVPRSGFGSAVPWETPCCPAPLVGSRHSVSAASLRLSYPELFR